MFKYNQTNVDKHHSIMVVTDAQADEQTQGETE